MADQTLKLRLGLFVALGLTVLSGLTVFFGRSPRLFSNRAKYTVVFPEAPGLSTGTPVRRSGVRIGEVTAIELDDATAQVVVQIELEPKYLPRRGEEAVISRGILNGDTSLDFVPQISRTGEPVSRGDTYPIGTQLTGVPPISTRSLLSQAQQVVPTAQDSIVKLTNSVQKFESVVPRVERAFDEIAELAKSGREFLPELRQTNTKIQSLIGANFDDKKDDPLTLRDAIKEAVELLRAIKPAADDARTLIKSARQTTDSINDVLSPQNRQAVGKTLQNIEQITRDVGPVVSKVGRLADAAETSLKELQARLAQAEKILANLDKAVTPIGAAVPEIVKNISETSKNLASTADQLTKTLIEAQVLLRKANTSDGTLNKVLTDPMLYNNLNDSVVSAMRVLLRLERAAKDLEVFADKVARKPETLGVGGAVRPSVGLKESPHAPLPTTPVLPFPPTPSYPGASPIEPSGPIAPIAPIPLGSGSSSFRRE